MNKILRWENIGFVLIILSFLLGDLTPTSYELRWTIITFSFVMAIYLKLGRIEKKVMGEKK